MICSDCTEKNLNLLISLLLVVLISCMKTGTGSPRMRLPSAGLSANHLSRNYLEGYAVKTTKSKERVKYSNLLSLLLFGEEYFTSGLRSSISGQQSTTNSDGSQDDKNGVSFLSRKLTSLNVTNPLNVSRSHERAALDCTAACHSYVRSWTHFYLKIGGWVTLGIVFIGVTLLVITHILGTRQSMHYQLTNIKWSEARRKSKLARWV